MDVLRFRPLPFLDRIRFGLLVFQARFVGDWRPLEGMTAKEWLTRLSGRRVYEQVWAAMLRGKFGDRAEDFFLLTDENDRPLDERARESVRAALRRQFDDAGEKLRAGT